MAKFKVGDYVRCVDKGNRGAGFEEGRVFKITSVTNSSSEPIYWNDSLNGGQDISGKSMGGGVWESSLELYKENNSSFMSSLKDIVSGFFITEPQKSRLAAGITDKEGQLTSEGKDVYLNYLLSKDTTFDADIVAKVIAAQEKK